VNLIPKSEKILVATTNPGKLRELSSMLDIEVNWRSLSDFQQIRQIEEDQPTFALNARKKAIGYSRLTGLWTIADDSGLMVDALDGAPGIKSARFSGAKSTDRSLLDYKNMAKLIQLLKDVPSPKRSCRFVCHLCLADGEKILAETRGTLEGLIADEPKGTNGFGYDPVFFVPALQKTVAQLSSAEKNKISHRAKAIRKLKHILKELLGHTTG